MRHKFFLLTCLLLSLVATSTGWLRAQTFNLQTDREPVTSLDGLWRFHTGDNPQWASPNFDDSKWPLLRSDEGWSQQGYKGYSGYAWYRFTLQAPAGDKPLALLLTSILTSYRVYADGKLLGGRGYMPPSILALQARPEVYDLPRAGPAPRTIHIAVRVFHYPAWAAYEPGGTAVAGSAAGDSRLIHRRLQILEWAHSAGTVDTYTYCVVALLFGLLVLGLFLFRPADREYLWFALLLLASAADAAINMEPARGLIPVQIFDVIEGCLFTVFQVAGLLFFSRVLGARRSFWWWFACAAACLDSLTSFTYILNWTSVPTSGLLELLFLLPSYVWIVAVLVRSAARKDGNARLLLVPVLLVYGFYIADNVTAAVYQLGWQSRLFSLDITVLHFPYNFGLKDLVFFVFALAMMLFLVRRFSLARREEERLSGELEAARGMQSLLVPSTAPNTPGFTVESVYVPASEVGGDFFQVQPDEEGSLLIVVGDVSGKGLKAAMTVSTIVGALRGCSLRAPAKILAHLNLVLHGQITGFATCCVTLIAADGLMTIANAGHLSPYRNGEELAVPGGLPLGLAADAGYEETEFHLAPGDRLTFMSDGVVEAQNSHRELFGFDRTRQISNRPAATIAETAKNFGQEDDITVLSVTRIAEMRAALA